ncbi:hypothetical protein LPJ53_003211 [Coemansia erecta]|uniref:Little elongation complex subunit 2 C-terminal domain-containing protein n=1 Tax=Coemansia erecta TaxID=147472 RepID=A0A9W8CQF3_9FUNG|nr:hypothetical protein LPJ53_003211 [Coemansia erecta]
MELRNRRLSGEGQSENEEDAEMALLDGTGDNANGDEDMASIGDLDIDEFEEIEEDEDIQRFISQSHTPAASRHPSPEAASKGSAPASAAQEDSESSDGEDSFEAAVGAETDANAHHHRHDDDDNDEAVEMQAKSADEVVDEQEEQVPAGAQRALRRCGELAQAFRDRHVPRLPALQFFDAATYRRYTVVTTTAEAPLVRPAVLQRPLGPVLSPVQKPSSLRSGGAGLARDELAGRTRAAVPASAAAALPSLSAAVAGGQDDVVGALLGVMQAPGARKAAELGGAAQPPQPPQDIPDDMLAAMMAIEGATVGATKPRGQPAPHAASNPGEASLAQQPAPMRLPRNYAGPFSMLTAAEHACYLQFARQQQQQQRGAQRLGARELTEYQRLKQRVETEQAEFRARLREHAARRMAHIEPRVAEAGGRLLRRQLEQARGRYAAVYVAARVLAIRPVGGVHVPLVYRSTVVQRGRCYGAREVLDRAAVDEAVARLAAEGEGDPADLRDPAAGRTVMSSDPLVGALAGRAQADVAVCDEALAALLTLQTMHGHDVLVPVEVRTSESAEESGGSGRPLVVVDRPLVAGRAATARRMRQMVFDAAVRLQTADHSGDRGSVALGTPEDGTCADASYTVWELGATRLLVRCAIDAFYDEQAEVKEPAAVAVAVAGEQLQQQQQGEARQRVTVTGAAKLEYFDPGASPEEAVVAGEAAVGLAEETQPGERLAWWLAAHLRGSPSQVWVAHVAPGGHVVRQARQAAGDFYADSAAAQQGQQQQQQQQPPPPTHALREILGELRRLAPGRYMLQHRRGAWDATVLRAVDGSSGERAAAVNLLAEMAAEPLDNDADYAPPVWRGLGPLHVPWTYPPADLERERKAATVGAALEAVGGGAAGGDVGAVRKRKKGKGKAKAKGKRGRKSE